MRTPAILAVLLAAAACGGPSPTHVEATTGMAFVLIPAGEFEMGSPPDEAGREPQEVRHRVRLSRPFYMGVTEVTQAQWLRLMSFNPSRFRDCPECPVERVNYQDVQQFIAALNKAGRGGYRLPTEAEWEYACRAGGDQPFGHRAALGAADANIDGRFPYGAPASGESRGTSPVGAFGYNPWGLADMSGNVWEWVEDDHCPYADGAQTDPLARCGSPFRVIRGGSWKFDGNSARCALRYTHRPQDRGYSLGLRLVRDAR